MEHRGHPSATRPRTCKPGEPMAGSPGPLRTLFSRISTQKKSEREGPHGAMHCEWVVLVVLVSFDEPVTGPSPWSPEVLPLVFYRAARRSDARRASRPGNRAFAG